MGEASAIRQASAVRDVGLSHETDNGAVDGSANIVRVALASAIGNTIEYYDFTLYATATALIFNRIFFPSFDPLVGSLAAFATFFVGYRARPLGGVLFGHFGDTLDCCDLYGRPGNTVRRLHVL